MAKPLNPVVRWIGRRPWIINAFGIVWCVSAIVTDLLCWPPIRPVPFTIICLAIPANAWVLWHYYGRAWLARRRKRTHP
jgi:hypothetical protein